MRGAEPAALAGPPASGPPGSCVRRKENKAPALGPNSGQGMVGTWWPDRGPGVLASWPEGKGDPLHCLWGVQRRRFIKMACRSSLTRKIPPLKKDLPSERESSFGRVVQVGSSLGQLPLGWSPDPCPHPGPCLLNKYVLMTYCVPGT